MGFLTPLKANKAYRLQQKGQKEEARKLYEEAFGEGLNDPRYVLAYALIMIRDGEYQKAKEFLVKHQKAPGIITTRKREESTRKTVMSSPRSSRNGLPIPM